MNPLKITKPIESGNPEKFQEEVNGMIALLSKVYEVVDVKYSTRIFNACHTEYNAIILYR